MNTSVVNPADVTPEPHHLFVYGTLRPGEVRWHHLEPFVMGDGVPATVAGHLFDTGLEYPAAMFHRDGVIHGRVYELAPDRMEAALEHLDEVEGAVRGLYHRVVVEPSSGHRAWAYECGEEALLARRLDHGDWLRR